MNAIILAAIIMAALAAVAAMGGDPPTGDTPGGGDWTPLRYRDTTEAHVGDIAKIPTTITNPDGTISTRITIGRVISLNPENPPEASGLLENLTVVTDHPVNGRTVEYFADQLQTVNIGDCDKVA